jgi:hypothetical protein
MKKKFNAKTRRKWSWGHTGYYKKFWCDSSWELAFLMYHIDNGIEIKRNRKGFSYKFYGKKHKFYPDFIVDGKYYEIKGRMDRRSKAKIKQFTGALEVIGKDEIQRYLDYSVKKYGIEFYKLLTLKK